MGLVNLVRDDCASAFKKHLAQAYNETTGIAPDVYICEPAQGTAAWPAEASVQV